jgi:hypothetical protein
MSHRLEGQSCWRELVGFGRAGPRIMGVNADYAANFDRAIGTGALHLGQLTVTVGIGCWQASSYLVMAVGLLARWRAQVQERILGPSVATTPNADHPHSRFS